jgi:hypothetical protein
VLAHIYSNSFDMQSIATEVLQDFFLTARKTCCAAAGPSTWGDAEADCLRFESGGGKIFQARGGTYTIIRGGLPPMLRGGWKALRCCHEIVGLTDSITTVDLLQFTHADGALRLSTSTK